VTGRASVQQSKSKGKRLANHDFERAAVGAALLLAPSCTDVLYTHTLTQLIIMMTITIITITIIIIIIIINRGLNTCWSLAPR